MRYIITSNQPNSFFEDSGGEFEYAMNINEVIEVIKKDWINTPDYISYLNDKYIEGEDICIMDFDLTKSVFINTQIETRIDIKIYE